MSVAQGSIKLQIVEAQLCGLSIDRDELHLFESLRTKFICRLEKKVNKIALRMC